MRKTGGMENIRPRSLFMMMLLLCLVVTPPNMPISWAHQEEPSNEFCFHYPPSGMMAVFVLAVLGLLSLAWLRRRQMETAPAPAPAPRIVSDYFIEGALNNFVNQGKTLSYYQGRVKFVDENSPRPASFIEVKDSDEANRILAIGIGLNNDGLLKPICIVPNPILPNGEVGAGRTFLAVEGFRFLCANWDDPTRLLFDHRMNPSIPGNPVKEIQDEIRNLAETLLYLHRKGFSCSNLTSSCTYFWDGERFKLLPDMHVENDLQSKDMHIMELGDFIRRTFLTIPNNNFWFHRDRFLDCFSTVVAVGGANDRLLMISQHPFLCSNIKKILEIFPDLDHAIESNEYNEREGIDQLVVRVNTQPNNFLNQTCFRPSPHAWMGTWYDPTMHPDFDFIMKYGIKNPPLPQVPIQPVRVGYRVYSYDVTDCRHLIRLLRNVFAHCYGSKRIIPLGQPVPPTFPLSFMYTEIDRCWPGLIYVLHEVSYL